MLQLRAILNAAEREADVHSIARLKESFRALERVQRHSPNVVAALLASPQVGAWAACCLRRLGGSRRDYDPSKYRTSRMELRPLWVDLAHLGAIAATAALNSGLELCTSVPARAGFVMLPTLGRASTEADYTWALAQFELRAGHATILLDGQRFTVPRSLANNQADWQPVRRLRIQDNGEEIDIVLDDLDPYWECFGLPVSDRLDQSGLENWRRSLAQALRVLSARHREWLAAVGAVVTCLVPLMKSGADGISASSRDAPGAVALTEPVTGIGLAVTLIHEVQHFKLNALHDMTPLFKSGDQNSYYSPWRKDPRPLAGLLHGTYAYLGVADFWRRERRSERLRSGPADLNFARHSMQLQVGYRIAKAAQELTPDGDRMMAGIGIVIERWEISEKISENASRIAEDLVIEHRASWRLRNLVPEPVVTQALAKAWLNSDRAASGMPMPYSVNLLACERGESVRVRLAIAWMSESYEVRSSPNLTGLRTTFPNASVPDLLLLTGRYSEANYALLKQIKQGTTDSTVWSGLVVAHRRLSRQAARSLLITQPELVRAVYEQITACSACCDLQTLSRWLEDLNLSYKAGTSISHSIRT
jgi:HEXXH motif-containing protein